jgi:hypothetical protein
MIQCVRNYRGINNRMRLCGYWKNVILTAIESLLSLNKPFTFFLARFLTVLLCGDGRSNADSTQSPLATTPLFDLFPASSGSPAADLTPLPHSFPTVNRWRPQPLILFGRTSFTHISPLTRCFSPASADTSRLRSPIFAAVLSNSRASYAPYQDRRSILGTEQLNSWGYLHCEFGQSLF